MRPFQTLKRLPEKSEADLYDENGMLKGLPADAVQVARSIVSYSLIVRKNEQTLSLASLGYLSLAVLIFGWWFWRVGVRMNESSERMIARQTAVANGNYTIGSDGFMRTFTPAPATLIPLPTFTPTIVLPTDTPSPIPTSTRTHEVLLFKLSFYDPNIPAFFANNPETERAYAEVNCAVYDYTLHRCVSTMANGDPFERWYGRGVACPPPLQLGDIIEVIYPTQLQGYWTCVDRGGAIVDQYLDFLLRYPDMVWTGYNLNNFPWASTVQVRLHQP